MYFDGALESVSKFIETLYLGNPGTTWKQLRGELTGEKKNASKRTAIEGARKLFRTRQAEGETCADLDERMAVLAA